MTDKEDIFQEEDTKQAEIIKERERAENEEKQSVIDYRVTFSSAEGFRVLQDLGTFCHILESTYTQNDTHESAFREGERNVGLFILSKLSSELRAKLIKEDKSHGRN